MKKKTNDELLQEFLDKGGEIQKIPAVKPDSKNSVSSTAKKVPELKTLAEGELLFSKSKKSRKKKVKKPDYSGINMDLIPDHVKSAINYDDKSKQTTEDEFETDQNSRRIDSSDES